MKRKSKSGTQPCRKVKSRKDSYKRFKCVNFPNVDGMLPVMWFHITSLQRINLNISATILTHQTDLHLGKFEYTYRYTSWMRLPSSGASVPPRLRSNNRLHNTTMYTASSETKCMVHVTVVLVSRVMTQDGCCPCRDSQFLDEREVAGSLRGSAHHPPERIFTGIVPTLPAIQVAVRILQRLVKRLNCQSCR